MGFASKVLRKTKRAVTGAWKATWSGVKATAHLVAAVVTLSPSQLDQALKGYSAAMEVFSEVLKAFLYLALLPLAAMLDITVALFEAFGDAMTAVWHWVQRAWSLCWEAIKDFGQQVVDGARRALEAVASWAFTSSGLKTLVFVVLGAYVVSKFLGKGEEGEADAEA